MIVRFAAIAVSGVRGVAGHPEILAALSPAYALDFLVGDFSTAFFALAAVVLAVTGAGALNADMGHFGRPAITRPWLILVFPACILSYMGQGADPRLPRQRQQPVLSARPGLGAATDGPAGVGRDGHRVPGGHHRRVSVASQAAQREV
jgi:K+ potassium transporter